MCPFNCKHFPAVTAAAGYCRNARVHRRFIDLGTSVPAVSDMAPMLTAGAGLLAGGGLNRRDRLKRECVRHVREAVFMLDAVVCMPLCHGLNWRGGTPKMFDNLSSNGYL